MVKTLDIIFKDVPAKKAMLSKPQEQYLVYLGEDYLRQVTKMRACGLFLGSKDKVKGDIDVTHQVTRSATAIELIEQLHDQVVLLVDTTGFFLMERTDAMEIAGVPIEV